MSETTNTKNTEWAVLMQDRTLKANENLTIGLIIPWGLDAIRSSFHL